MTRKQKAERILAWIGHVLEVLYWTIIRRRFTVKQAWKLIIGKSHLVYYDRYDEYEWK